MADYSIDLKGLPELNAFLKKAEKRQQVKVILKNNVAQLSQKASVAVPVKTGTLKRSMSAKIDYDGLSGQVDFHTNYAPYVEYGTRFMYGRRYLKRAFQAQENTFIKDLQELMK